MTRKFLNYCIISFVLRLGEELLHETFHRRIHFVRLFMEHPEKVFACTIVGASLPHDV